MQVSHKHTMQFLGISSSAATLSSNLMLGRSVIFCAAKEDHELGEEIAAFSLQRMPQRQSY